MNSIFACFILAGFLVFGTNGQDCGTDGLFGFNETSIVVYNDTDMGELVMMEFHFMDDKKIFFERGGHVVKHHSDLVLHDFNQLKHVFLDLNENVCYIADFMMPDKSRRVTMADYELFKEMFGVKDKITYIKHLPRWPMLALQPALTKAQLSDYGPDIEQHCQNATTYVMVHKFDKENDLRVKRGFSNVVSLLCCTGCRDIIWV